MKTFANENLGEIVKINNQTIQVKNFKTKQTVVVKKSEIYNFVGSSLNLEEIENLEIGGSIFTDDMNYGYLYDGSQYGN